MWEVHSGQKSSLSQHGKLFSRAGLRVSSGTQDLPRSEYDAHWLSCYRYDNSSYILNFSCHLLLFKAIINFSEKNGVFCREWFAFLWSILSQEYYLLSAVLRSIYILHLLLHSTSRRAVFFIRNVKKRHAVLWQPS